MCVIFLCTIWDGHLLLLITRTERWFFLPKFPAWQLWGAILATQVLAIAITGFGWFMPAISLALIGITWAYNIVWMFILGAVRVLTEKLLDDRTAVRRKHKKYVHKPLQPDHTLTPEDAHSAMAGQS